MKPGIHEENNNTDDQCSYHDNHYTALKFFACRPTNFFNQFDVTFFDVCGYFAHFIL